MLSFERQLNLAKKRLMNESNPRFITELSDIASIQSRFSNTRAVPSSSLIASTFHQTPALLLIG